MTYKNTDVFLPNVDMGFAGKLFLLQIHQNQSQEPGVFIFLLLMAVFVILLVVVSLLVVRANRNYTLTQTYSGNPYVLESYDHELAVEFMELNSLQPADHSLKDLAAQTQDLGLLTDEAFEARKRENLREFLEVELLHFKNKYLDKLDEKDKKRLQEDEKYLQRVLKNPGNTLNPNFNLINTYIDNFFKNEGFWDKYRISFTRDSIIGTKAKFLANYKKLIEDVQVSGDQVLNFYLHSLKKFEQHPETFLTAKKISDDQIKSILSKNNNNSSTSTNSNPKKIYPLGGDKFEGGGSTGHW